MALTRNMQNSWNKSHERLHHSISKRGCVRTKEERKKGTGLVDPALIEIRKTYTIRDTGCVLRTRKGKLT